MRVLHIHNEIENKGGTEVYLSDIQELLPTFGCSTQWLAIQPWQGNWRWAFQHSDWKEENEQELKLFLRSYIDNTHTQLICIHNLFDRSMTDFFLSLCPVIKFSHSPVLVCPGKDKYWRFSNKACTQPYGIHCFYHIYAQGCSNRHPKRVIKSWMYVKQELENANRNYARVVVMSNYNSDRLLECGVKEDKIFINPYFTKDAYDGDEFLLPKNNKRIGLLFIGRIVEGKGLVEMIVSMKDILRSDDNIHLDIIGDGALIEKVKELINQLAIGNSITLHGWLPRKTIDNFLKNCYLVIFPSTYPESFGIVGIEAMMASKPVVGFDSGGVSTWLKDNRNGFLIKNGNIPGLGQAVKKLIEDKNLYLKISQQSRQMALDNYLPDKHLTKLVGLFKDVIEISIK